MTGAILTYMGSLFLFEWGIAHLVPTRTTVNAFGNISQDNKRIIMMEWITEGVALIFIGTVVVTATYLAPHRPLSDAIDWIAFSALNILSIVSLLTGFRNSFVPFKLCPIIFTSSSILIVTGAYIRFPPGKKKYGQLVNLGSNTKYLVRAH